MKSLICSLAKWYATYAKEPYPIIVEYNNKRIIYDILKTLPKQVRPLGESV